MACVALAAACNDLPSEPERDSLDVPGSEIITLTRAGGSLPVPADGVTEDTLIATIPEGSATRLVTFNTTGGRFVLAGGKQIKVTAVRDNSRSDKRLVARAAIVSDSSIVAATSASVGDYTAYVPIKFVKPAP